MTYSWYIKFTYLLFRPLIYLDSEFNKDLILLFQGKDQFLR